MVAAGVTETWFSGFGKELGVFLKKLSSSDTTQPFYS